MSGPVLLSTLLAQAAAANPTSPKSSSDAPVDAKNAPNPSSTSPPSSSSSSSSSSSVPLRIEGVDIKVEPKKASFHGPGSATAEQILQETVAALRKIEVGKAEQPLLSESVRREHHR